MPEIICSTKHVALLRSAIRKVKASADSPYRFYLVSNRSSKNYLLWIDPLPNKPVNTVKNPTSIQLHLKKILGDNKDESIRGLLGIGDDDPIQLRTLTSCAGVVRCDGNSLNFDIQDKSGKGQPTDLKRGLALNDLRKLFTSFDAVTIDGDPLEQTQAELDAAKPDYVHDPEEQLAIQFDKLEQWWGDGGSNEPLEEVGVDGPTPDVRGHGALEKQMALLDLSIEDLDNWPGKVPSWVTQYIMDVEYELQDVFEPDTRESLEEFVEELKADAGALVSSVESLEARIHQLEAEIEASGDPNVVATLQSELATTEEQLLILELNDRVNEAGDHLRDIFGLVDMDMGLDNILNLANYESALAASEHALRDTDSAIKRLEELIGGREWADWAAGSTGFDDLEAQWQSLAQQLEELKHPVPTDLAELEVALSDLTGISEDAVELKDRAEARQRTITQVSEDVTALNSDSQSAVFDRMDEVVQKTPVGINDIETTCGELLVLLVALQTMLEQDNPPLDPDVAAICQRKFDAGVERLTVLKSQLDSAALTQGAAYHSKALKVRAAIAMLNKTIAGTSAGQGAALDYLNAKAAELQDRLDGMEELETTLAHVPLRDQKAILGKKKGSKSEIQRLVRADRIPDIPLAYSKLREEKIMQVALEAIITQANNLLEVVIAPDSDRCEAFLEQAGAKTTVMGITKSTTYNKIHDLTTRIATADVPTREDLSRLRSLCQEWLDKRGSLANAVKKGEGDRYEAIERLLEDCTATAVGDPDSVKEDLHQAHLKVLNENQVWDTIETKVTRIEGDEHRLVTDTITPAAQLGNIFDRMNGQGVNCHTTASCDHAVNLASTTVTDGRGGDPETVVFRGLRHAVNSAFGITKKDLSRMTPEEVRAMVEGTHLFESPDPADAEGIIVYERKVADATSVLCGTNIDDPRSSAELKTLRDDWISNIRRSAAKNRSLEIVTAALIQNEDKLTAALNYDPDADPPQPKPKIQLSSLSLLTPDWARSGKGNERAMLRDQLQAWDDASGLQTLTVLDADGNEVEVEVEVEVAAFNFGVNAFAMDTKGQLAGGHSFSKRANTAAMKILIGEPGEPTWQDAENNLGIPLGGQVGQWLLDQCGGHAPPPPPGGEGRTSWRWSETMKPTQGTYCWIEYEGDRIKEGGAVITPQNTPHPPKWNQVALLGQQIHQIWESDSYRTAGEDPYKIVSRIALVTHMIGNDPAFNCKSGKDRTGNLDVEVKHLALELDALAHDADVTSDDLVPEVNHELTDAEKHNRLEISVHGPNHRAQQLNTGVSGFKLKGLRALDRSFAGSEDDLDEITRERLGLSGEAGS